MDIELWSQLGKVVEIERIDHPLKKLILKRGIGRSCFVEEGE